jgi:hypothetical protein
MIKYSDIPSMKRYLKEAETKTPLYGGLGKLKELASGGMDVEFSSMFCLEHGWLGSVTETEKHDPKLQAMSDFLSGVTFPSPRIEQRS